MARLFQFSVERARRSDRLPQRAITAPDSELDVLQDIDKGLSDNRARYIAQSANSRCGAVAPLPAAARRPGPVLMVPAGLAEARRAIGARARRIGATPDSLRRANQLALRYLADGRSIAATVALCVGELTGRRNGLLRGA